LGAHQLALASTILPFFIQGRERIARAIGNLAMILLGLTLLVSILIAAIDGHYATAIMALVFLLWMSIQIIKEVMEDSLRQGDEEQQLTI